MQDVRAEVAATVTEILVQAGDTVSDGELLLLLESMKMEIPVSAPCAGSVGELAVGIGDAVEEGQSLLTLRPGADPASSSA